MVREENTVSHYAMNSYKDSGEELIALYGDENEVEFDLSTSLLID